MGSMIDAVPHAPWCKKKATLAAQVWYGPEHQIDPIQRARPGSRPMSCSEGGSIGFSNASDFEEGVT